MRPHQDSLDVVLDDIGRGLAEDFNDYSETNNCFRSEAVPLSDAYQCVYVNFVDEDVALQDGADKGCHTADVLIISALEDNLNVLTNHVERFQSDLVIMKLLGFDEEIEGENLFEIFSGDISLIDLAKSTDF